MAAVVTSSKGGAKISVTPNGAEVFQQSERMKPEIRGGGGNGALRVRNVLVLSASETDGTPSEMRTVIYERPASGDRAGGATALWCRASNWAVVIGVGNYGEPEVPPLLPAL